MCVWKCKEIVSHIHIFIWFWLQKPCDFPSVPSTGIFTKKSSLFEGFPSLTMTKNLLHCNKNLAYNTMTDIIIKFNIVEMQHCNRSLLIFGFIIKFYYFIDFFVNKLAHKIIILHMIIKVLINRYNLNRKQLGSICGAIDCKKEYC